MIDNIYRHLVSDDYIKEQVGERIKFYEYPEVNNLKEAHIIIDPLDVPVPKDYGDNDWLTNDYLFQIEVWSNNRATTKNIASRVRDIMWGLNFYQGSGMDEYDKDFGIFRDARRYRGKAYVDTV